MPHPMLHGTDIIYSDVIVHIELARRPSYILFTLVFPAVVLSCVSAAGLLLPPGSEGTPNDSKITRFVNRIGVTFSWGRK